MEIRRVEGLSYEDPVLEVGSEFLGDAALVVIDASGLADEISNVGLDHGNVTLMRPNCNPV